MIERLFTKTSPIDGVARTMKLEATQEQWDRFDCGELIQRALPHLNDDQREFILTGITPEQWDEAFPEEDENDDEPAL